MLRGEAKPCLKAEGSFAVRLRGQQAGLPPPRGPRGGQGPSVPHFPERRPSGLGWEPGDCVHTSLCFHLRPLNSISFDEWLYHPQLPPGLGDWASVDPSPETPQPSLGGAMKPLHPPSLPRYVLGEHPELFSALSTPSPAGFPPRLWTERTSSTIIPTNPSSTASAQLMHTLLKKKKIQQMPHFPNGVSRALPCAEL